MMTILQIFQLQYSILLLGVLKLFRILSHTCRYNTDMLKDKD